MRWPRNIRPATVAIAVAGALALMTTPVHARSTCYNNGHPEHRFIVCVDDGGTDHGWAWGQYDTRYYSNTLVVLQGRKGAGEWVNLITETRPYSVFVFAASIKTDPRLVDLVVLDRDGYDYVRACMAALENGVLVGRCSDSQEIVLP